MPIVDGLKCTKMIWSFEKTQQQTFLGCNGQIPVLAMSAPLVKKDQQLYVNGGFDGWIPKPINLKRLSTLLVGIAKEDILSLQTWGMGKRQVVYAAST